MFNFISNNWLWFLIGFLVIVLILIVLVLVLKSNNLKKNNVPVENQNKDEFMKNGNESNEDHCAIGELKSSEIDEVQAEPNTEDVSLDNNDKKKRNVKYMVTYDKNQRDWVVKKTGSGRASKRCATKKEALEVVEKLSQKQDLKVSVQKKNGKFQKKSNIKKSN